MPISLANVQHEFLKRRRFNEHSLKTSGRIQTRWPFQIRVTQVFLIWQRETSDSLSSTNDGIMLLDSKINYLRFLCRVWISCCGALTTSGYLFLLRISLSRSFESLCWSQRRSRRVWCSVWIYVRTRVTENKHQIWARCSLGRMFSVFLWSFSASARPLVATFWDYRVRSVIVSHILSCLAVILEVNAGRLRTPLPPAAAAPPRGVRVIPERRCGTEVLPLWNPPQKV